LVWAPNLEILTVSAFVWFWLRAGVPLLVTFGFSLCDSDICFSLKGGHQTGLQQSRHLTVGAEASADLKPVESLL